MSSHKANRAVRRSRLTIAPSPQTMRPGRPGGHSKHCHEERARGNGSPAPNARHDARASPAREVLGSTRSAVRSSAGGRMVETTRTAAEVAAMLEDGREIALLDVRE